MIFVLSVLNMNDAPERVKKALIQIKKTFGSYRICKKHGELVTPWRYYLVGKQKCGEKYICLGCEEYKRTHHTRFPEGKDKDDDSE